MALIKSIGLSLPFILFVLIAHPFVAQAQGPGFGDFINPFPEFDPTFPLDLSDFDLDVSIPPIPTVEPTVLIPTPTTATVPFCSPNIVKIFQGNNEQIHRLVDPDAYVHYANSVSRNTRNYGIYHNNINLRTVSAQAKRVCQLVEPQGFPSCWALSGYDSPEDNYVVKWTGSVWSRDWAKYNNSIYTNLTCATLERPDVSLTVSDSAINAGEQVTLTWESEYGAVRKATCEAQNFSATAFVPAHTETAYNRVDCRDGQSQAAALAAINGSWCYEEEQVQVPDQTVSRPFGGTTTVSPTTTTTYTYTCQNGNGSQSASATVEVLIPGIDVYATASIPATALPNTPVTFTGTVYNGGNTSASNFPSSFQISNQANVSSLIAAPVRTVAAGASSAISSTHTFAATGTYLVRACADMNVSWGGVLSETNEGNNCSAWHTVVVNSNLQPDLTASVGLPLIPIVVGTPVNISSVITNIGAAVTGN